MNVRIDRYTENYKIKAIKAVRQLTGCSLADAKATVEDLAEHGPIEIVADPAYGRSMIEHILFENYVSAEILDAPADSALARPVGLADLLEIYNPNLTVGALIAALRKEPA